MIRRRYDHTIRLTQRSLAHHPDVLALPVGTQVLVTDCAGEVLQAFGNPVVEAFADPDDDEAELDCDGVPPSVRARVLLREVLGLWGSPVGAKAAE